MKKFIKILCSIMVTTSMLLSSVSVFANTVDRVVKISIGNKIANVNGENVALNVAPYVQKPSDSMMIPLRFVSTALGIPEENIQYNPTNKEITINYNGRTVKFIANTNKLILNGESFDMFINNTHPVYTEIKNGNTFIPLRALESAFGIKIDWESSTKTAIMTNTINSVDNNQVEANTNENIQNNNTTTESTQPKELTEEEKRKLEEEVVRLVNEEREKKGLQPLEISEKLMKTAREKSDDMFENDYFSHTNPNGYNMARDLNVSENISAMNSPSQAMEGWKNSSEGHFTINILDSKAKYIGVGYATGIKQHKVSTYKGIEIEEGCVNYWTQQFSSDDKWANEN